MDHFDIAARIKEWLSSDGWPFDVNEDDSTIYTALKSGETDLVANVQIRIYDHGLCRAYGIWPDDVDPENEKLLEYVSGQAGQIFDYGRLRLSRDRRCIYYVSDIFINDVSELTDDILDKTITGSAVYMAETYGPEIAKLL